MLLDARAKLRAGNYPLPRQRVSKMKTRRFRLSSFDETLSIIATSPLLDTNRARPSPSSSRPAERRLVVLAAFLANHRHLTSSQRRRSPGARAAKGYTATAPQNAPNRNSLARGCMPGNVGSKNLIDEPSLTLSWTRGSPSLVRLCPETPNMRAANGEPIWISGLRQRPAARP
jgi:hypothetical protein